MALSDRYDLFELRGEGSFGRVYRAYDRNANRPAAVKILQRITDDDRRRFHLEAVILFRQLPNDYVVGLFDHSLLGDEPYIVMEYCALGSLHSWVARRRPWKDVASALLHAATGLAGVHAANTVHRDIKPPNLLVADDKTNGLGWRVKLADFGIAAAPHPVTGAMTRTAMGTPGYMAPELRAGGEFLPPADVYSLGVVGIELLTGSRGLPAQGPVSPPELKALLLEMLSAQPERRPSAATVARRLSAIVTVAAVQAPPVPRSGSLLPKFALASLVAVGVPFLFSLLGGSSGPPRGPDGRFVRR